MAVQNPNNTEHCISKKKRKRIFRSAIKVPVQSIFPESDGKLTWAQDAFFKCEETTFEDYAEKSEFTDEKNT